MFTIDPKILEKAKITLDKNCPPCENEIITLCDLASNLPLNKNNSILRLLVHDIDDFINQIRWNLGYALLLLEFYDLKTEDHDSAFPNKEELINEMPIQVMFLLRKYITNSDKVFYSNLHESRRGVKVSGWIYHMLIDNAIYRTIATLDRLAHILWITTDLPMTYKNGENVKIYFRSKKMTCIHEKVNTQFSKTIVEIASSPLMEFSIKYRDQYSHFIKSNSEISGFLPIDEWQDQEGKTIIIKNYKWDSETLFAFANAIYHQLLNALPPSIEILKMKSS